MTQVAGSSGGRRAAIAVGVVAALAAAQLSMGVDPVSAAPRQVESVQPFVDISEFAVDQARQASAEPTLVEPDAARGLVLDRAAMESALAPAPMEDGSGSLVLELPAPDGTTAAFDVWETAIMAPELSVEFPEIKTYAGEGIDDPGATIVFDLTPHGFHAQVLSLSGNWYIDPSIRLGDRVHLSYFRDDLSESPHGEFIEHNTDEIEELSAARPEAPVADRSGAQLRTHRLAVAANTSYSAFHGGTVPLTQAAIVTAVNRVTGIYELEVAIRLQLVANNSNLVYIGAGGACTSGTVNISSATGPGNGTSEVLVTTAAAHGLTVDDVVQIAGTGQVDGKWAVRSVLSATQFRLRGTFFTPAAVGAVGTSSQWNLASSTCDPFSNSSSDINVNQGVVDTVIGDANYDLGHVFTTGSGGVAGLGVVGVSDQKARGTTGLSSPTADKFFVDFVAHEMGHQYGGSHTWNGNRGSCSPGNWGGSANGLEPGSGSTIQGYGGICSLDDLQNLGQAAAGDGTQASDPYFHSRSFDQIIAHTTGGSPGDVGAAPTGNSVPVANAGSDVTVPAQTPFFLTASATDGDPDVLTYNWEQRDGGLQRALDNPQITAGPLFRSFLPTTDGTRYFPRLADVASGNTNQNGACPALNGTTTPPADCWSQFLIQTAGPIGVGNSRALNFRATVRDNRAGGGGVDTDDAVVTVHNTGTKFAVTSPNTGVNLSGNQTVTWNIAGTTAVPISAATVSIRLSTDGGLTYPTQLLANTANDGTQQVTLPSINTSTARIMVHSGTFAAGAGFFDISDVNFTITPGALTNDNAASATALAGDSGTAAGINVGATGEAGEVQPSCVSDTQINSVWWSWTAPASGTIVFDTVGSSFDTTLAVYTGVTLPGLGQEVGCNDDSVGLQSQVTVAASQGTDYLIRVDGFDTATGTITLNHNLTRQAPPWPDFNGDGSADRSVFRPPYGAWFIQGQAVQYLGLAGDVPVPADYNGDDWTERAVFRNGTWFIAGLPTKFLGQAGDVPVPGDYDGDGSDEVGVYRNGAWYVEGLPTQFLGQAGDVPVPGDYDGDGTTERAVYRPSIGGWYVEGLATQFLGTAADVPVPGDYDGDGAIERAVYRPVYGAWFVEGAATQYLGLSSDVVAPADFDGDGSVERAVFRPAYGAWYVEGAATQFYGLGTDVPLPIPAAVYNAYYVP